MACTRVDVGGHALGRYPFSNSASNIVRRMYSLPYLHVLFNAAQLNIVVDSFLKSTLHFLAPRQVSVCFYNKYPRRFVTSIKKSMTSI